MKRKNWNETRNYEYTTIKKSFLQVTRHSALIIFYLLIFSACGKKLPPLPPESFAPEPVKSSRAITRDGKPTIAFSKPARNADGSKLTDLAGFKVMRRTVEDKNGCKTCPEKFDLIKDIDAAHPVGALIEGEQVFFTDTTAEAGTMYEYKIITYNRDGYDGQESNKIPLFTGKSPDIPAEFSGIAGDKVIDLKWSQPQTIAGVSSSVIIVGYNVYRRIEGRGYPPDPVNLAPIKEGKFADFGLKNGIIYFYTVRAVAEAGGSLIEGSSTYEIGLTPREAVFDELKGE